MPAITSVRVPGAACTGRLASGRRTRPGLAAFLAVVLSAGGCHGTPFATRPPPPPSRAQVLARAQSSNFVDAINRFRRDTGRYPQTVFELLDAPAEPVEGWTGPYLVSRGRVGPARMDARLLRQGDGRFPSFGGSAAGSGPSEFPFRR